MELRNLEGKPSAVWNIAQYFLLLLVAYKKKVTEGVKKSGFLGDSICERSLIIRNISYLIIDIIFRAVPEK